MEIKNVIIGILILAIAMTSLAYAYKEEVDIEVPNGKDATIRVSGESSIEVEPDIAYVYIEIETDGFTSKEAKKNNDRISEDVIEALEFTYVKNIETDYFNIVERYWEDTSTERFVATNVIKVTTDDVDWVGRIVDKAVNNGATGIRRVSYELSEEKEEEFKKKALKEASENAYQRALAMAEGLDKEIGDLVLIEESNFKYFPYNNVIMEATIVEKEFNTKLFPEDVEIRASITLVYEVI